MIFGMGATEVIVILIVVLVIFGPKNLPKIGSAIGKTVKNVREGMSEGEEESAGKAQESNSASVELIEDEDDADAPEQESAPSGQYCPHCGAHNGAGAAFCSTCGSKLSDEG